MTLTQLWGWLRSWRRKPPVKPISCVICKSTDDVRYCPLMTGLRVYDMICIQCYLVWYRSGLTSAKEIMKVRNEQTTKV